MTLFSERIEVDLAEEWNRTAVSLAFAPCEGTIIGGRRVHCAKRWLRAAPNAHRICAACYARMAVLSDSAWRAFVGTPNRTRLATRRRA